MRLDMQSSSVAFFFPYAPAVSLEPLVPHNSFLWCVGRAVTRGIYWVFFTYVVVGNDVPRSISHYENTPIQIYRKFHLQKLKIFR